MMRRLVRFIREMWCSAFHTTYYRPEYESLHHARLRFAKEFVCGRCGCRWDPCPE